MAATDGAPQHHPAEPHSRDAEPYKMDALTPMTDEVNKRSLDLFRSRPFIPTHHDHSWGVWLDSSRIPSS